MYYSTNAFLHHANAEIQLETARAVGNMTRFSFMHTFVLGREPTHRYYFDGIISLVKHSNQEMAVAATGTLVNLSANDRCREAMLKHGALGVFHNALTTTGTQCSTLCKLICQVRTA